MSFNRSARAATAAFALLAGVAWFGVADARAAVTAKECHAQFKAAKEGGTLGTQTYKEFKAAQCAGSEAEADDKADTPAKTDAAATPAAAEEKTAATKASEKKSSAPAYTGNAVFPSKVSSKYSSLSAGKARMKTCVDQYNANKATGANAGLKWIQKGGGYYSVCNKHLKGL
ncbi:hypothetical protein [Acetobacter sp.]|uniref:hypothetical protein n=1 Tax=Acetobacter sp. TaxID=440 RepID=UPI0039ED2D7B